MNAICHNPDCRIEFEPRTYNQIYCSIKCRKKFIYKNYYYKNRESCTIYSREYCRTHKEERKIKRQKHNKSPDVKKNNNERLRNFRELKKTDIIMKLGGSCALCGESEIKYLTLDHINNDGYKERLNGKHLDPHEPYRLSTMLRDKKITLNKIKSKYQVLCWNCNAGIKRRKYMETPNNHYQEYELMWWIVAYHFFGACRICGDIDLRHLCISHIHNDGGNRRKNGEPHGADLFRYFEKLGWPETLKNDYCLECFNCNCSKQKAHSEEESSEK